MILKIIIFLGFSFSFYANESTKMEVLTWTRVQKPWYAPNFFVKKKMNDSIPEYLAIQGLLWKSYTIEKDNGKFGGIYFWDSKTSATKWFNPEWFNRIKSKYGETTVPILQLIFIPESSDFLLKRGKSKFLKVFSLASIDKNPVYNWAIKLESWKKINGFQTALIAKDDAEKVYIFTFWANDSIESDSFFQTEFKSYNTEGNCEIPIHIEKKGDQ